MRLSAFKARVEALAQGEIGSSNASLVRALNKKEVRRCSKAWDAFTRNCTEAADARPSGVAPTAAVRLPAARSVRAEWRLPRLDARVPLELTPRRLASANATVARFLLEAKAVRERDIPATWNDELLVCQGALDAWVKREIGALHCLAPQFVLRPVWGSVPDRCSCADTKRPLQPSPDYMVPAGRTAVGCRAWAGAAGAGDADAWRDGLAPAG